MDFQQFLHKEVDLSKWSLVPGPSEIESKINSQEMYGDDSITFYNLREMMDYLFNSGYVKPILEVNKSKNLKETLDQILKTDFVFVKDNKKIEFHATSFGDKEDESWGGFSFKNTGDFDLLIFFNNLLLQRYPAVYLYNNDDLNLYYLTHFIN